MDKGPWGEQPILETQRLYRLRWMMGLAILAACLFLVLDYGVYLSPGTSGWIEYGYIILGVFYFSGSILQLYIHSDREVYFRENRVKYALGLLLLLEVLLYSLVRYALPHVWGLHWVSKMTWDGHILFFQFYLLANVIRWITKITQFLAQFKASPARFILMSFSSVILLGTGLLLLPKATSFVLTPEKLQTLQEEGLPQGTLETLRLLEGTYFLHRDDVLAAVNDHLGKPLNKEEQDLIVSHAKNSLHPVDALFTATSAVCVTGLIVVDTATVFTPTGQMILLGLIQIGGLGIMTVTAFFSLMTGQRLSGREQVLLSDMLETNRLAHLGLLLRNIFLTTFFIEACGAGLLYLSWGDYFSPEKRLYTAVFHAVSAFCNAGFSTFSESLMRFAGNPSINLVVCSLIIIGGLGFGTLRNISNFLKAGKRRKQRANALSIQTKLVLITTLVLIVLGTLLFGLLEYGNTLKGEPLPYKCLRALFQSVTFRTAGFNTIDCAQLRESSLMFAIVWMFIGAAPGSTGGGIKVTTFAILLGTVFAGARGRTRLEIFHRTIPNTVLYQTLTVITLYLAVMMFVAFLLSVAETHIPPLELVFETVSALGTVGLSTGITGKLSIFGRILIIATMFLGRLGPFTVALAIGQRQCSERYRYPEEKVQIG